MCMSLSLSVCRAGIKLSTLIRIALVYSCRCIYTLIHVYIHTHCVDLPASCALILHTALNTLHMPNSGARVDKSGIISWVLNE